MGSKHLTSAHYRIFLTVFLFGAFVGSLQAQRGAVTQSRNLVQLVDQSERIVQGRVISARVERHPELRHLFTVVVSLRVEETLKGPAEDTVTFRQFIWDVRDRSDVAGYRKGQRLLLLLNPTTTYGLSSPAGLQQGRFRIGRDTDGNLVATNGLGNAALLRGLDQELPKRKVRLSQRLSTLVSSHRAGPIRADDLRDLIRQILATR